MDPAMNRAKPHDIAAYKKWLKDERGAEISVKTENYYLSVTNKISADFRQSGFWLSLTNQLTQLNQEYYLNTKYYLFSREVPLPPEVHIKPFSSFLLKTFRKNVVDNEGWPAAPPGGWVLPAAWFTQINDIIRTYFVVKYLDGVSFFVDKLQAHCRCSNLTCDVAYEAKEEGYYAAHTYVTYPCEVPEENWDTRMIDVQIEIQVTTQLQEVIRRLLHKYYEQRRKTARSDSVKWQWDYTSEEFAANYLGHILHYVEGMIMDVRNRQEETSL